MPISSFFDYPEGDSNEKDDTPPFLAHWGDEEWDALLAHVKMKTFKAGETVLAAGDMDPSLYLLGEGRLEVLGSGKGPGRRIALLDVGAVVGELVFLDGKPRSADVRAVTEGRMMGLSPDDFKLFSGKRPDLARDFLLDLGRILSLRLRETTALALAGRF